MVTRPWVDPALTEAITGVHTMGGLINRRVDYLDDQGRPLVLGFHAVGDAHTCTNPLYGRGCSLAMVQATLLADALADHPGDGAEVLTARAVAFEQASETEIRPWYRAAVNQDRLNRQAAQERAAERDRTLEPGPAERARTGPRRTTGARRTRHPRPTSRSRRRRPTRSSERRPARPGTSWPRSCATG